jgi:hypothetical protein
MNPQEQPRKVQQFDRALYHSKIYDKFCDSLNGHPFNPASDTPLINARDNFKKDPERFIPIIEGYIERYQNGSEVIEQLKRSCMVDVDVDTDYDIEEPTRWSLVNWFKQPELNGSPNVARQGRSALRTYGYAALGAVALGGGVVGIYSYFNQQNSQPAVEVKTETPVSPLPEATTITQSNGEVIIDSPTGPSLAKKSEVPSTPGETTPIIPTLPTEKIILPDISSQVNQTPPIEVTPIPQFIDTPAPEVTSPTEVVPAQPTTTEAEKPIIITETVDISKELLAEVELLRNPEAKSTTNVGDLSIEELYTSDIPGFSTKRVLRADQGLTVYTNVLKELKSLEIKASKSENIAKLFAQFPQLNTYLNSAIDETILKASKGPSVIEPTERVIIISETETNKYNKGKQDGEIILDGVKIKVIRVHFDPTMPKLMYEDTSNSPSIISEVVKTRTAQTETVVIATMLKHNLPPEAKELLSSLDPTMQQAVDNLIRNTVSEAYRSFYTKKR